MDSLLDALQQGRLIELPENNREHTLQLLAHILEAIPSVPNGTDVVGLVMERERVTSTALGVSMPALATISLVTHLSSVIAFA